MSDTDTTQIQGPRDLFSIRSQLAQQANPLRAKIVLFSLLYRPFSSSSGDWSTLKQQDLGEFIRRAYNKYASLEELKRALTLITAQLDSPSECDQAAAAIYTVLKPYYVEVGAATEGLQADTDDLDSSQTWDIPIGVAQKDVDSTQDDNQTEPTTSASLDLDSITEVDAHAISQPSQLSGTDLSNATTAILPDPMVEEMDDGIDGSLDEVLIEDDPSTDDHSRWLDSFEAAIDPEAEGIESPTSPVTVPRRSAMPVVSELPIVTTADLEAAATAEASTTPTAAISDHPTQPQPQTQSDASKRNGRRTGLAQLLTQHVNSRDEVDAIVQRYSKTLTEQVTAALDDLEGELADCLGNCEPDTATQIAGEALGRVLLSVSESIGQMRQALESIPGVEPIVADWPHTRPPQTAQPPYTQPPDLQPPPDGSASPAAVVEPEVQARQTGADRGAEASELATPPDLPDTPDQPDPAIDPVQCISHQFATLLAKRDMSIIVKQRDGCIHLIAEASPLPERTKLIRFVSKTLSKLDLPPIATLRLHGRRTGARAFDWSEDLPPIRE
ncbi:MAG: hypothetical protein EAZ61_00765 [Oscillatoriales cyanobacterium]|nr:MAG: hypothetical protein EAZ61_00765 [Oscillatoriales cyanobacterium]